MRKLHLIALSAERDGILDALSRTNAVEVTLHEETEGTEPLASSDGELGARLAAAEEALALLLAHNAEYEAAHGNKKERAEEPCVSLEEFLSMRSRGGEMDALCARIRACSEELNACTAENTRLSRELSAAERYASVGSPFSAFSDTRTTRTRLGSISSGAWLTLREGLDAIPLAAYEAEENGESVLAEITAHRSAWGEVETLLSAAGFSSCPYREERTGGQLALSLQTELGALASRKQRAEDDFYALAPSVRNLKIWCDLLGFGLEKERLGEKLRGTACTFFLEAYVPASREEDVKAALSPFKAACVSFSEPAEGEPVPTLLKNNKVVENFETITNMYSPPNARELDPNTVMSFFYSLFIGFIMADIGYGLMMLLGGGFLYYKNRAKEKGGIKSLAGVFAVGGVFAVFWGFLFNSLLGIAVLPFTVMPDPQSEMWTFIGIDIPAVLIISLLIGIVQLAAGYFCKLAQYWRREQIADGIFEGGVWGVFSIGVELAAIGLVQDFGLSFLTMAGGIVAGAMLLVAVLTAGRHERFFGKLSKGFGALYGLINYFTDVLSYIRLYGLMLTGAVIAQVVSQYAVSFLTSGSALIVLGAVLMVVGHVFNLAISLLGAYIHTARLQYVEFFGRFYEGDGRLFVPLGSARKHIRMAPAPSAAAEPAPQGA